MSHREEASGKTKDTLEKLCLSAGLGTPRGPPGRAGGSVWGEGSLGIFCSDCCLRDPVPDQAVEDGWMDGTKWILISTHARLPTRLHSLSRRVQTLHSLSRRVQTLHRQTHHRPDHAADHPDHPNPRPGDLRPQLNCLNPHMQGSRRGWLAHQTHQMQRARTKNKGGLATPRHSYNTRSERAPEPKQEPETETETETETEESECDSKPQPEASIKIAAGAKN
ncbi:hypothetical protein L3Q82_020099 [Scortum barcoo]|uniref:Uncharacterized protein n=1 Tax=Scortum barcoo TaxID=214431 RepID=A0ACB8VD11_9TELE|nr:hypothetical protein L3Q82_020099 [Scortum barcoo]